MPAKKMLCGDGTDQSDVSDRPVSADGPGDTFNPHETRHLGL
jgi:hypothetical protein